MASRVEHVAIAFYHVTFFFASFFPTILLDVGDALAKKRCILGGGHWLW